MKYTRPIESAIERAMTRCPFTYYMMNLAEGRFVSVPLLKSIGQIDQAPQKSVKSKTLPEKQP